MRINTKLRQLLGSLNWLALVVIFTTGCGKHFELIPSDFNSSKRAFITELKVSEHDIKSFVPISDWNNKTFTIIRVSLDSNYKTLDGPPAELKDNYSNFHRQVLELFTFKNPVEFERISEFLSQKDIEIWLSSGTSSENRESKQSRLDYLIVDVELILRGGSDQNMKLTIFDPKTRQYVFIVDYFGSTWWDSMDVTYPVLNSVNEWVKASQKVSLLLR